MVSLLDAVDVTMFDFREKRVVSLLDAVDFTVSQCLISGRSVW